MEKLTPMMQQFKSIKQRYPDAILFFRVGDFYEMFFDDAVTAARELEIILTSRDSNKESGIPLAGVPYHAAQNYIARLLEKGYKVAVCDQVEEAGQSKGLVKREVTRVITPGTKIEENLLQKSRNNYLASICRCAENEAFGLTFIDITTGELLAFHFDSEQAEMRIVDELMRLQPAEIIAHPNIFEEKRLSRVFNGPLSNVTVSKCSPDVDDDYFPVLLEQFSEEELQNCGLLSSPAAALSTTAVLKYVKDLQEGSLKHVREIKFYRFDDYVAMDAFTTLNLEILETLHSREKKYSLLGILDRTKTAMGGRLLRKWVERPLIDVKQIQGRWEAVGELKSNYPLKGELANLLSDVYDLERISGRINLGAVNPRELLALKKTLLILPQFNNLLRETTAAALQELREQLPDLGTLACELERAISDNVPLALKEGGIFKEGFSEEIDELRRLAGESKDWLLNMEKRERERTGIKSLKVSYNKIFGYYIEVTKANLDLVPPHYIRKQTLVNAERFITDELKEKESSILKAEERLARLEYELFEELRKKVATYTEDLQKAALVIANLDCYFSLADAAAAYNYVKPRLSVSGEISIKGARHPIVEQRHEEPFIPNDVYLNGENDRVIIVTGPNMAGKSTYCRSVALLLVMAQAGSFVPADDMQFYPVERIFARVGASDDLGGGRSTFMLEMEETSLILSGAHSNSLVILDEIGRGTSTYDGMSLAQAILEYLHDEVGAMVLFSTHYHELTALGEALPSAKNYTVQVKEKGKEVIFLRKVIPGKADKSYGINVARLANLPGKVIDRAEQILKDMETAQGTGEEKGQKPSFYTLPEQEGQLSMISPGAASRTADSKNEKYIIREIKNLNLVSITPLQALNKLFSMQQRLMKDKLNGEKES